MRFAVAWINNRLCADGELGEPRQLHAIKPLEHLLVARRVAFGNHVRKCDAGEIVCSADWRTIAEAALSVVADVQDGLVRITVAREHFEQLTQLLVSNDSNAKIGGQIEILAFVNVPD